MLGMELLWLAVIAARLGHPIVLLQAADVVYVLLIIMKLKIGACIVLLRGTAQMVRMSMLCLSMANMYAMSVLRHMLMNQIIL